jgi:hypothetical protein
MRSCDASLMKMEGTANGGEYEEEEGRRWIGRRRRLERDFSSAALVTRGGLAPELGESQIVSKERGCRQNSRQTTDQRSRNVDACVGEGLLWILNYENFSWKFWVGSMCAEVRESLCLPVMNLLFGSGLVVLLMLFFWCVCTWCSFCQKSTQSKRDLGVV